jgi:unsaturated rhamnogalacturonyl hydrolase
MTATTQPSAATQPLELLDRVAGRTLRYDFTVWQWGDAIAIDGLLDAADVLDAPHLRDRAHDFFRRWARRPLAWNDHLVPGGALLRLAVATGDDDLRARALDLAGWLEAVPRTASGLPLHRPDLGFVRNSCWVDTIYHEPPFLARLAEVAAEPRWYGEAMRVTRSHLDVLATDGMPFLAHSYDAAAEVRRGYGWGRGNAWALLGLVDLAEVLPIASPERAEIEARFASLAGSVRTRQDASGLWRTLLHDREAYLESSTAAMFGAAFTKGMRLGILDGSFEGPADRAWQATCERIDASGTLFGVSAWTIPVTTREDDPAMYKALPTESNWWGQGAAMRALVERISWDRHAGSAR